MPRPHLDLMGALHHWTIASGLVSAPQWKALLDDPSEKHIRMALPAQQLARFDAYWQGAQSLLLARGQDACLTLKALQPEQQGSPEFSPIKTLSAHLRHWAAWQREPAESAPAPSPAEHETCVDALPAVGGDQVHLSTRGALQLRLRWQPSADGRSVVVHGQPGTGDSPSQLEPCHSTLSLSPLTARQARWIFGQGPTAFELRLLLRPNKQPQEAQLWVFYPRSEHEAVHRQLARWPSVTPQNPH